MPVERKRTGKSTASASDLWRRIEQSGLDQALKKLESSRPELTVISSVSSEDASHISSVMVEFCEMLNCVRLAYVDNETEILDDGEREQRYLSTTCPTILQIWCNYSTFSADFVSKFIERGWLNSSDHRDLLASVTDVTASAAKLLVMTINREAFHGLEERQIVQTSAKQEAVPVVKTALDFLTQVQSLGETHTALTGMTEILSWLLYGLYHISDKLLRQDIESRSTDDNLEDVYPFVDNISDITKQLSAKWGEEPKKEEQPPPQNSQPEKKSSSKQSKSSKNKPTNIPSKDTKPEPQKVDKNKRETYLEVLQQYSDAFLKFSEESWTSGKLPSIRGYSGVQIKFRVECFEQLGKLKVDACPMVRRKTLLDELEITDDFTLHSDLFVIDPQPLKCSQEVIIQFPLTTTKPRESSSEIFLKLKCDGEWKDTTNPEIVKEEDHSYIVFRTTSCESFTALSLAPVDSLTVTPQGANYVSPQNGKLEVLVPEDCFQSEVNLGIKVIEFERKDSGGMSAGIVEASDAVQITTLTKGAEMKRHITVHLAINDNDDEKDTELVFVRCNEQEVQVLDKRQYSVKCTERNDVLSVDIKGFWRIAVLRVKRIFLNMRETLKKEFLMGYGFKQPCNIVTYIDDLSRGDEMQTIVMEVVEKNEVDNVVEARRQTGLVEVKKSRSKDVLLKRGDQIWFQIDGQIRCTEAMTEAEQTLCYLTGSQNMVAMPTEIKRDPEKMPDAMIFYKQKPNNAVLHSIALMTRDLSELASEEITARLGLNQPSKGPKRVRNNEEAALHILKMESLMSLARELTFQEASTLGQQLGVKPDTIRRIKDTTERDPVAGNFQILCSWRGRFARATMADFLVSSLKAVGKYSYADLIMEVRKHNRGLERSDFINMKRKGKNTRPVITN